MLFHNCQTVAKSKNISISLRQDRLIELKWPENYKYDSKVAKDSHIKYYKD